MQKSYQLQTKEKPTVVRTSGEENDFSYYFFICLEKSSRRKRKIRRSSYDKKDIKIDIEEHPHFAEALRYYFYIKK